jgi:LPS-assembly lipoprotein
MSSPKAVIRIGLILLALSGATMLAGCSSFRAVYGDSGIASDRIELSYAKPGSRLDQVIYQDLALKFGKSQSASAPRLTVNTASSSRALTHTGTTKPATQYETTVTANATLVTADGRQVFQGSRRASASYVSVGQVLADTEASNEAQERAAREAGELLRLAILGALAAPAPGQH